MHQRVARSAYLRKEHGSSWTEIAFEDAQSVSERLALMIGGALALAGGRVLETLLFGVSSTDWITFGAVAIILVAVAAAASYAPARRAMRVDPILALRTE